MKLLWRWKQLRSTWLNYNLHHQRLVPRHRRTKSTPLRYNNQGTKMNSVLDVASLIMQKCVYSKPPSVTVVKRRDISLPNTIKKQVTQVWPCLLEWSHETLPLHKYTGIPYIVKRFKAGQIKQFFSSNHRGPPFWTLGLGALHRGKFVIFSYGTALFHIF